MTNVFEHDAGEASLAVSAVSLAVSAISLVLVVFLCRRLPLAPCLASSLLGSPGPVPRCALAPPAHAGWAALAREGGAPQLVEWPP